ncbi:nitric oxide-associated protein 1 [Phlebotomus argentipes]|uniref:nitric oxide-associated protein 1 n=1 Tax=Phlebotomus argentipes TaxID=94469 RepID=UPI00289347EC|nr:nitric oxide-associated protein 1 [Phlebotomus argentipes]
MFCKSRNFLRLRHLFLIDTKCTSTVVTFLRKPVNKRVSEVFQKHENDILFSSYMEDHFLKLGFKRGRALQNMIKSKERKMHLDSGKVKAFPLALKYVSSPEDRENYEEVTAPGNNKITFSKEDEEFLTSLRTQEMRKFREEVSEKKQPNWLQDYEYFDEDENTDVKYGTPDPSVPISKVPCSGCGAQLQCAEPSLPGYLPSEIFKKRNIAELQTMICQRCHFLKNYNTALNVSVHPDEYLEIVSSIAHKPGLGILIVDLLDFPSSVWADVHKVIGEKRPLFIVGNKVDLIPKDCRGYLDNIKDRLVDEVLKKGIQEENIKHVALISATTGFGVEELITQLHNKWGYRGDVYLIGATNVGKSSLFNALLRSDYCKVQAQDLVKRATASPWPGTTIRLLKFPIMRPSDYRLYVRTQRIISERYAKGQEEKLRRIQANKTGSVEHATLIGHIGQSFKPDPQEVRDSFAMGGSNVQSQGLNEDSPTYRDGKWCYDTPGIILTAQIHHKLNIEEILMALPKTMLRPRTFFIKPGMSLFLAGIGRIDFMAGRQPIRLIVYSSLRLPILVCHTSKAEEIYADLLTTDALQVPQNLSERSKAWPSLQCGCEFRVTGERSAITVTDIVFSSIGWVGVNANDDEIALKVWSPDGEGVFLRTPPLLSQGFRLHGKRIRGSLAYRIGKAFIKQ